MFRRLILMVVVLGFFTALFGQVNPDTLFQKYVPKVIIEAKWGSGPGELGYDPSGPGFGPEGFAIDSDGTIYILDGIHGSVKKYNIEGKMLAEYKYEAFNSGHGIVVDKQGNIYVFTEDSHNNVDMREILKYSPQDKSTESFWFPEADPSYGVRTIGNRMIVEKKGDIIFDSKTFGKEQKESLKSSDIEHMDVQRDGIIRIWSYDKKSEGVRINIPKKYSDEYYSLPNDERIKIGLYFLGKDEMNNYYFYCSYSRIYERPLPLGAHRDVKRVIYKYSPMGKLLAMVVLPEPEIYYLGFPARNMKIDGVGNIYAMIPYRNGLKIYKFIEK